MSLVPKWTYKFNATSIDLVFVSRGGTRQAYLTIYVEMQRTNIAKPLLRRKQVVGLSLQNINIQSEARYMKTGWHCCGWTNGGGERGQKVPHVCGHLIYEEVGTWVGGEKDSLFAKMVMGRLGPLMGKTHPNRMPGGLQTKRESKTNKFYRAIQETVFLTLRLGKNS